MTHNDNTNIVLPFHHNQVSLLETWSKAGEHFFKLKTRLQGNNFTRKEFLQYLYVLIHKVGHQHYLLTKGFLIKIYIALLLGTIVLGTIFAKCNKHCSK